jgi:hypothetical protein
VEDEAILLGMWRDLVAGKEDGVRETLTLMVDETAITPILKGMQEIVAKMVAVDLAPDGMAATSEKTNR